MTRESPAYDLAGYCSVGNAYQSFLTSKENAAGDIDFVLKRLDCADETRSRIALLLANNPDYASGISDGNEQTGADKTVVYLAYINQFADGRKKGLEELFGDFYRNDLTARHEKNQDSRTAGAWPAAQAAA